MFNNLYFLFAESFFIRLLYSSRKFSRAHGKAKKNWTFFLFFFWFAARCFFYRNQTKWLLKNLRLLRGLNLKLKFDQNCQRMIQLFSFVTKKTCSFFFFIEKLCLFTIKIIQNMAQPRNNTIVFYIFKNPAMKTFGSHFLVITPFKI